MIQIRNEKLRKPLEQLKTKLERIYNGRLEGVILFGSLARGEETESSDIDILVILNNCPDPIEERETIGDFLWQMDLEYNTVMSVIFVDSEEFATRRSPLLLNVRKEGIRI